ncbi:hypothetical protein BAUCODRAFT_549015 [Baudoinia panamericana UAMH 10762]|uniref:Uncharacterized protein n=1 Tax=Baudoinia panamericana (strain UAMH 10762) TaxID=717646 RepID=M2LJR2_BAUPA|nr:uncharacterized protein BAUCODRAFT_549015 [Baudoinia panamericana UAMH 10762]EMC94462.1 hypothetical protein BAUCODRAFT_549015 [Baudoinia panamericana UAMH 10762]
MNLNNLNPRRATQTINQLDEQIAQLIVQVDWANEHARQLEATNTRLDQHNGHLRTQIGRLANQVTQVNTLNGQLHQQIDQMQSQTAQDNNDVQQLNEDVTRLQTTVQQQVGLIWGLRRRRVRVGEQLHIFVHASCPTACQPERPPADLRDACSSW